MSDLTRIRPHRALLHPAWLGALALLAVNDHVFKGSDLLPAVVTGKLSDVAGLLVAPALLATLLGVRSRRGWVGAHVAIGAVFAAIQLSSPAAVAWSMLFDAIGLSWVTTMDPTDLLALPALLLSARMFGRAQAEAPAALARRSLELGAATTGLMLCAATSQVDEFRPSIFTDVYIHNSGDTDLVIRIRHLRDAVDLDCDRVAEDPGRLLSESLFGTAESWTVAPGVNHGLRLDDEWDLDDGTGQAGQRECHVVWFEADNVAPRIVMWTDGSPATHTVDGEDFDPEDPGAIEIVFDDDGQGHYEGGDDLLFAPVVAPPVGGECAPQADGDRLAWNEVGNGRWTLVDLRAGIDGCWALDLDGASGSHRLYLCVPLTELPFAPGDALAIDHSPPYAGGGDFRGIVVRREAGVPDEGTTAAEVHLVAGDVLPTVGDLAFALVPDYTCDFAADATCGTVARAASLTVVSPTAGGATLRPGTGAQRLEATDGTSYDVVLAHAEDRVVVDPQCAEGPDTLGPDLEVAIVLRGAAAQ